MSSITMMLFGFAAIVIIAVLVIWHVHNRLIILEERCDTALSDIDVRLKHRHSVLPSLVKTVKAFMGHERAIIDGVNESRAAALHARTQDERMAAETQLSMRIGDLIDAAEMYPDIKADHHFRTLRADIVDLEEKITAARHYHNTTVKEFNATIRQFPGNVLATKMRIGRRSTFNLGLDRMAVEESQPVNF